ncbi:MAG TPA: molybdopterin-dependent oxidoreductase [Acidimicrobiales bacterium]|nr:molybdopterin-dependent oxidoreductase [Acidimicrobiales bacterium]
MDVRTTSDHRPAGERDEPVWQQTACILCECNCGLEVAVEDGRLAKIRGDQRHPASQGYTCEKPLRLDRYQNGAHRLDTPMRRRPDGTYEPIGWDTALDEIAARLAALRAEHGGASVAFYGGGGQGNHLGGSHARSLMNHLGVTRYSNALAQEKTGEAYVDARLYGSHTVGDFERAEVSVFIGKNPWQSHGVARARVTLREIARDPERSMIVIDPRLSETAAMADIHLRVRPGTDLWCLVGLVAVLVQEDLVDHAWLERHTRGAEQLLGFYAGVDVERCAAVCGVDETLLRTAARRIGTSGSVATYEDLGIQQAPNSTLNSYVLKMLWILGGHYAKPGGMSMHSWLFPLAGRWHATGGDDRGAHRAAIGAVAMPLMRLGAAPLRRAVAALARGPLRAATEVAAAAALDAFFDSVGVPLAQELADVLSLEHLPERTAVSGARVLAGMMPAAALPDEILTDHPDRVRALWVEASNPVHSLPGSARFRQAFEALELSVVIDVAMTETARCADYVLPASSQFEKWELSLFTLHFPHNTAQLRRPLMPALAGTRDEPWIYAEILDRLEAVPSGVLADLRAAARVGRASFALAFFATVRARSDLRGLTPYLLHRTLGAELGLGREATATAWGLCHLAAIAHRDAVTRAGFTARGFRRGDALFDALLATGEGVVFTDDPYEAAWDYVRTPGGRFDLVIPELLEELKGFDAIAHEHTSPEFPFVLSAGERRSFTANVIIRDPRWRRRDPEGALRMNPDDARRLGLEAGAPARVTTRAGSAVAPVEITEMMQPGHVSLPNGMGVHHPDTGVVGVALNELTSAEDVDHHFGSPWHKHVPARVEPAPDRA